MVKFKIKIVNKIQVKLVITLKQNLDHTDHWSNPLNLINLITIVILKIKMRSKKIIKIRN